MTSLTLANCLLYSLEVEVLLKMATPGDLSLM